jgi:CBS domain-containing protein
VVTLRPDETAAQAAETLLHHAISGAPVLGPDGRLVGLLSEFDCLHAVAAAGYEMDGHDEAQKVADLMSRECQTVSPDLDLFGLAHEFVRLGVRRLPVVEGDRLVGLVSRRDVLRAVVELRHRTGGRRHYPDYPAGRDPIHDYPRGD